MSHAAASGDAGLEAVVDIHVEGSTIALEGAFDVRSTAEVRWVVYALLAGDDEHVVVDVSAVSAIDVTALRLLAVATRHAWLTGKHLTVRNPGPTVRRMIHLSHLAHAIEAERTPVSA